MPGLLTKAQRVRVRRVINNMGHPIRHLELDSLRNLFGSDLIQLKQLRMHFLEHALMLGYDPEEKLPDVVVNWVPSSEDQAFRVWARISELLEESRASRIRRLCDLYMELIEEVKSEEGWE